MGDRGPLARSRASPVPRRQGRLPPAAFDPRNLRRRNARSLMSWRESARGDERDKVACGRKLQRPPLYSRTSHFFARADIFALSAFSFSSNSGVASGKSVLSKTRIARINGRVAVRRVSRTPERARFLPGPP